MSEVYILAILAVVFVVWRLDRIGNQIEAISADIYEELARQRNGPQSPQPSDFSRRGD
jgi:hypothetical protein